jgi:hypothetical protein
LPSHHQAISAEGNPAFFFLSISTLTFLFLKASGKFKGQKELQRRIFIAFTFLKKTFPLVLHTESMV